MSKTFFQRYCKDVPSGEGKVFECLMMNRNDKFMDPEVRFYQNILVFPKILMCLFTQVQFFLTIEFLKMQKLQSLDSVIHLFIQLDRIFSRKKKKNDSKLYINKIFSVEICLPREHILWEEITVWLIHSQKLVNQN